MGQLGPLVRIIDAPEPVIGFRTWRVYGTGYLRSVAHAGRWEPGADFTAHCKAWPDGPCPHCECLCGIHAYRDPCHLKLRNRLHVHGAVALWGRIIEHELGFRAQHAWPVALVESHYAQRVAGVYGLPVLSRENLEMEAGEALLKGGG